MSEDAQARQRIVTELYTTFLVEAGAGSGKTTSLVQRMVALVRTGTDIRKIAAITFTRKAASELRTRFQIALEMALRDEKSALSEPERENLAKGLQDINLCFLGTIHSFCGRLLRERPLEAELDPGFRELEEEEDKEFADLCWDDYLLQLKADESVMNLDELKAMGLDVSDLRAVYHKVSGYPDVDIFTQDGPRPDFDLIRNSLFPFVDEAKRWIPSEQPEKGWDTLQDAILQTERQRRFRDFDDDLELVRLVETLFEKKLAVTQNRWTDKSMAKETAEKFTTWQQTVMEPFLRRWREYRHPFVIRFVQPAVAYCTDRRIKAGMLNFQDLLMKAAQLLREHAEVRRYFQNRYQNLLVDEFQDTDPIQAEVMFLLTGADADVADWRTVVPRRGSLFIVGDPKQSIYRFRRADIATYNFVKQRIVQTDGEVLELTANFRSVQAIGTFVDGHFTGVFPEVATHEQAKFVPLATQRENPTSHHGVYLIVHPGSLNNKDAVNGADAERIAKWIHWACNDGNVQIYEYDKNKEIAGSRPAQAGDFMILTYHRAPMHMYGQWLEAFGIPADVVDSQQTYQELHDLAMLTRCLANPSDKVALVATLRGILFGVSDNDLYHYKREGHALSLFHFPSEDTLSAGSRRVQQVLARLRHYYDWTQELPALSALERILADTGYLVYTAVQQSGMNRAGMIVTLLQHLSGAPDTSTSWSRLAEVIRKLDETGTFPSSSLYPGRVNTVTIMNLHKAKGLEAPIVFLAGPSGFSEHDADSHVDRTESENGGEGEVQGQGQAQGGIQPKGYFMVDKGLPSARGFAQRRILAQPPQWSEFADKEAGFLRAERDRLLYVAATRAKQMLVISRWEGKANKDPWSPFEDTLKILPELDTVEVEIPERPPFAGSVDVEQFVAARGQRINQMKQPTFVRTTVTTEVKAYGSLLERRGGGLGVSFGTVVHRCLDACGNGLDEKRLPILVQVMSEEEGLNAEHAGDVLRAVNGVLGSEVWQRSRVAVRRLHEIPFIVADGKANAGTDTQAVLETAVELETTGGAGSGVELGEFHSGMLMDGDSEATSASSNTTQTIITHGVIDMAFEEADGWVVVDFKTDAFDADQENDFVAHYADQVNRYRQVWQETFGYSVKEAGLYFTNRQKFFVVK